MNTTKPVAVLRAALLEIKRQLDETRGRSTSNAYSVIETALIDTEKAAEIEAAVPGQSEPVATFELRRVGDLDFQVYWHGEVSKLQDGLYYKNYKVGDKVPLYTQPAPVSGATSDEQQRDLSDEGIVKVLASFGIDADKSKYGFPELQVSTNIPGIRKIIAAYLAAPVGATSDEPSEREQLIACLGDDAAKLEASNPDDEMAQTMRDAARMLEVDDAAPAGPVVARTDLSNDALADVYQKAQNVRDVWVDSFSEPPPLRECRAYFVRALLAALPTPQAPDQTTGDTK